MRVWIAGYHGLLREALGLFVDDSDKAELYFLFRATNCHFRVELMLHKGQALHMIWTEKSSVNEVSTLTSPLSITSIPMKMSWPFCFYLSIRILRVFLVNERQATLLWQVETNLF